MSHRLSGYVGLLAAGQTTGLTATDSLLADSPRNTSHLVFRFRPPGGDTCDDGKTFT